MRFFICLLLLCSACAAVETDPSCTETGTSPTTEQPAAVCRVWLWSCSGEGTCCYYDLAGDCVGICGDCEGELRCIGATDGP